MDYELAKRLKAAGWPQTGGWGLAERIGEDAVIPTLSELVEACGSPFQMNSWPNNKKDSARGNVVYFAASPVFKGDYGEHSQLGFEGDSYEEVVAKLWIALNEK